MNYGRFIVKNAFRNTRRTILTVLSTGFSLFLLIALRTFVVYLYDPPRSDNSKLRLCVNRSTSFTEQLPLAYLGKLEKVPHVVGVLPFQFFMGKIKDMPRRLFPSIAVDASRFWAMYPELKATEQAKQDFVKRKTACILGDILAEQYGYKVGDRITLVGTIYPVTLEFEVVGIYHSDYRSTTMFMHFDYLSDAMGGLGTVSTYWLMADKAESIAGVMETVDGMFRNSPAETRTTTEKAFVLGFMNMLGNVRMLMGSVSIVVIFTMLIVASSNMAMTIRERLREIAILKSIGYPRRLVLWLIMGEAVFLSLMAGGLGCLVGFAMGFTNPFKWSGGFMDHFAVSPQTYGLAIVAGIGIGVFSALLPAIQASRMTILEAFRRLD